MIGPRTDDEAERLLAGGRSAMRWAITRDDGLFYTHTYSGPRWHPFPRMQVYQSKSAASRQCNRLDGARVTSIEIIHRPELT